MTYNEIYLEALTYLGETSNSTGVTDYSDRAEYLLPGICAKLSKYSAALGDETFTPCSKITKSDSFALDDRLAFPAAAMLASLLIAPEDIELSNELSDLAADMLRDIMPCSVESVTEVY